jgi:hypothetical protein
VALRIVLDTNVIVSALRSSRGASFQILDAVLSQRLELLVSVKLAFEYEEVLKRESEALGLHNVDVDRLVQRLCDIGIKIPTGFRSTPILTMKCLSIWQFPAAPLTLSRTTCVTSHRQPNSELA